MLKGGITKKLFLFSKLKSLFALLFILALFQIPYAVNADIDPNCRVLKADYAYFSKGLGGGTISIIFTS